MTDDLIERLRAEVTIGTGIVSKIRCEAADRIEALSSECEGLEELLRRVRDGLIGNTAIITAGKNYEQAQLAGNRLNKLCAEIDAALSLRTKKATEHE